MDDTIIEQELVRNERLVTHSKFGHLRLRRPTPAMDAKIAECRRKVYHSDLRNSEILTKEEIQQILMERGVWKPEYDDDVQKLTLQSADIMARLTALGYDPSKNLETERESAHRTLQAMFPDPLEEVEEALERILLTKLLPSSEDMKILRENATSSNVEEQMNKLNAICAQDMLLNDFVTIKLELNKRLEVYTQFFGDTIEERANRTERMAHIFYCVTQVAEDESLWDTFEDMWDEDPEHIAWLHSQLFYFQNAIDEDSAEVLQQYGFMARTTDTGALSEDSPEEQTSNSDGESPEKTPSISSDAETPTS